MYVVSCNRGIFRSELPDLKKYLATSIRGRKLNDTDRDGSSLHNSVASSTSGQGERSDTRDPSLWTEAFEKEKET